MATGSPVTGIRHRSARREAADAMEIAARPSPNHGERRQGERVELVVLHYTAMGDAEAALARMCDPACEVSAHYLIGKDGAITRLVDEAHRAWHAGAGKWADVDDVNSRSIGIERGSH